MQKVGNNKSLKVLECQRKKKVTVVLERDPSGIQNFDGNCVC